MNFSDRYGYAENQTIIIRNDAPESFRVEIARIINNFRLPTSFFEFDAYVFVCKELHIVPLRDIRNVRSLAKKAVEQHICECEWFQVYNIIENYYKQLKIDEREKYEELINTQLYRHGVGYIFKNGIIEVRGDNGFQDAVHTALEVLEEYKNTTAFKEIKEAINDLSRRPEPDLTGTVHHSMAALECLAKKFSKNEKLSLGVIIKKDKSFFPAPLGEVVEKLWGYASEHGRHVIEGKEPAFEEAELIVHISASLCTYLSRKFSSAETSEDRSTL